MEERPADAAAEKETITEGAKSPETQNEETGAALPDEKLTETQGENTPADEENNTGGAKHPKAKENLSLLGHFISTFIVACIVIVAAALIGVKVTGCYLFTIETGSMTPTYPVNTVVLVKPYESFEEIEVGDVVTYVMNEAGATVTHRVISIDTANETVTTQGDANDTADASPVLYGNVVGKVVIGIPKIGQIVKMVTDEENRNIIIVVIVILLAWAFLWDAVWKGIKKRKPMKKKE